MAATYEELIAKSKELAASGDIDSARRVAEIAIKRRDATPAPQTNMVEQSMSGVNEGIAGGLGFPVDTTTTLLNGMFARPKFTADMVPGPDGMPTPTDPKITAGQGIENPMGGSQSFLNLLGPTISDVPPQTTAQRYGRRVGQEFGATAVPGGFAMRGAKAPLSLASMEAASAVGAGVAGQTSQEIAPGNQVADTITSMLGGLSPIGAARIARPGPQAPSLEQLRAKQGAAYDAVDASPAQLTPQATQRLQTSVMDRSARDGMDPFLAPKATRTADKINEMITPRISEVEKSRRLVGRDVASSIDKSESAIGMGMKDEITNYLDGLTAQDVTGGDPSAAVSALREGRDMTRRIKKSEDIDQRLYKAENRAATSGTGGNEVNAIRQNIRQILDDPRKKRNYSKDEVSAMEDIVRGSPTQNALRLLGRFSPTSGALPAMAGVGAGTALGPLGALPSAAGLLAKGGAEALTKKSVDDLGNLIRNGKPLPKKTANQAEIRAAIAALIAQQSSVEP